MAFDILSGVPIPQRERSRKYNIDNLEVGHNLVIPQEVAHTPSAIYAGARQLKMKVSIRKFTQDAEPDEDGSLAYRAGDTGVWRTE